MAPFLIWYIRAHGLDGRGLGSGSKVCTLWSVCLGLGPVLESY